MNPDFHLAEREIYEVESLSSTVKAFGLEATKRQFEAWTRRFQKLSFENRVKCWSMTFHHHHDWLNFTLKHRDEALMLAKKIHNCWVPFALEAFGVPLDKEVYDAT